MEAANRYLKEQFLLAFHKAFKVIFLEEGSALVLLTGCHLEEILTTVFAIKAHYAVVPGLIPLSLCQTHVRVHSYSDGRDIVFQGTRKSACYDSRGKLIEKEGEIKEQAV